MHVLLMHSYRDRCHTVLCVNLSIVQTNETSEYGVYSTDMRLTELVNGVSNFALHPSDWS